MGPQQIILQVHSTTFFSFRVSLFNIQPCININDHQLSSVIINYHQLSSIINIINNIINKKSSMMIQVIPIQPHFMARLFTHDTPQDRLRTAEDVSELMLLVATSMAADSSLTDIDLIIIKLDIYATEMIC